MDICRISLLLSFVVVGSCLPGANFDKNCRCVPDQWEGILSSVDREFDLKGGQAGSAENHLFISYDYVNKLFSMTDIRSGNKAVADYKKGYKYVMRGGLCHGIRTKEIMRRMCLPDDAEFLGKFNLGSDIPIDIWQFNGPYNVSMRTIVIQKNCIPFSEEVFMAKGNVFASVTSSLYLDVTLGIADDSVFQPPSNCVGEDDEEEGIEEDEFEKRGTGRRNADSLLHAIRNRLYIFN